MTALGKNRCRKKLKIYVYARIADFSHLLSNQLHNIRIEDAESRNSRKG